MPGMLRAIADLQGEHSRLNLAIDGLRAERTRSKPPSCRCARRSTPITRAARAQWEREARDHGRRSQGRHPRAAVAERDELTARLEESSTNADRWRNAWKRPPATPRTPAPIGRDRSPPAVGARSTAARRRRTVARAPDARRAPARARRDGAPRRRAARVGRGGNPRPRSRAQPADRRPRRSARSVRRAGRLSGRRNARAGRLPAKKRAPSRTPPPQPSARSIHRLAGELEQTRGREAQALAAAGRLEHELAEIRNCHSDQVSSVEAIAAERDRLRATLSDDRDRLSAALKSAEVRAETLERQWSAEREQLLAASVEARTHHDAVAQALRTANELLAADLERTRAETADHAARIAQGTGARGGLRGSDARRTRNRARAQPPSRRGARHDPRDIARPRSARRRPRAAPRRDRSARVGARPASRRGRIAHGRAQGPDRRRQRRGTAAPGPPAPVSPRCAVRRGQPVQGLD